MKTRGIFGAGALFAAVMTLSALFMAGRAGAAGPQVFLLYDNIGEPYFTNNVDLAGRALAAEASVGENRVVVFHKRERGGNIIYELVKDSTAKEGFAKRTLKTYDPSENDTFTPLTLATVVGDIRTLVPAPAYGFAFGSHGMGWIPKSVTIDGESTDGKVRLKRYFTSDDDERLDAAEFAGVMGRWAWDFIIFDDCYMASVEALYEMRTLARFFIASSAEILLDGFPYDRVIKTLIADWGDMAGVAEGFVDYYRQSTDPDATVSVIRTSELEPLAARVRDVLHSPGWRAVDPVATPVQFFEGLSAHIFFDLDDYLHHGISPDSAEYRAFAAQLQKTVVFKDATKTFTSDFGPEGRRYAVTSHSGLTSFIPWAGTEALTSYYRQTPWYGATYGN